jgi:protein arginine kinase
MQMTNENDKQHLITNQNQPWDHNDNDIWLASTVNIRRNIEKFNFPGKLSTDRRKQVVALLSKELLKLDLLSKPTLIRAEEIGPLEKEFLIEHFLSNDNFIQAHSGEAFVLEESGQFLASINMRDHLHLQLIECKGEIESAWSRLVKIETTLSQNISFDFSPKYGFLTADPSNCGTALTVSIYLQLPGLVHTEKLDGVLEKVADDSISLYGIQGDPTEIIGDVLVIQNNYSIGVTEENIISNLRSIATKMLIEENSARSEIRSTNSADAKDKISRAFGILTHSYQIDAIEALNAISLLKLGVDMDWIKGITRMDANRLFFMCRRSHLLSQFPEKTNLSQEEIIHKRAEYIHKALAEAHLQI